MKTVMLWVALMLPLSILAQPCEPIEPAPVLTHGTKPNIHPGVHFVEPPYAGFDPCNGSVDLHLNEKSETFVLVLHGAGGSDQAQKGVGERFKRAGFSVLIFDAFKMNRIEQEPTFWTTAVHNGSTGRMIYFSGLAAIKWLGQFHPERSKRIVVYGVSTGGLAAINLAATPGLERLQRIFAEAPNNAGIGLPDRPLIPIDIFYGSLDNFGGAAEDEYLWKRRSPCLWNSPNYMMPIGNTVKCSYEKFKRGERGQSVEEWIVEQRNKGSNVSLMFVEGAAHGIFNGREINSLIRYTPSGIRLHMTTGARVGVPEKLFDEVLRKLNGQ